MKTALKCHQRARIKVIWFLAFSFPLKREKEETEYKRKERWEERYEIINRQGGEFYTD